MDRRKFMGLLGGAHLVSIERARADHKVISADPLEVVSILNSLEERYTPIADFYVRNHYRSPSVPAENTLTIEGEVEKPQRLALVDLSRVEKRGFGAVLECAGNPVSTAGLVSNGLWEGFALSDILAMARPSGSAAYLHLFGRDGYSRSVPLERAGQDALLVTSLNGQPLVRNLGAPWRILFPRWYGMDSVKWLERIVVATAPLPPKENSYLEMRNKGPGQIDVQPLPRLQVKSVIVEPAEGSVVERGRLRIRGLAWTGEGTISKVEASGDGGNQWRDAQADRAAGYEWVRWESFVQLDRRGPVELASRATDSGNHTQPDKKDPARLDGYTSNWYHRVKCVVV